MPSMSAGVSPASRIALRTAQLASARVVRPEPRVYVVSPTPAIAYLSRRYLGVVASTSLLIGTAASPFSLNRARPSMTGRRAPIALRSRALREKVRQIHGESRCPEWGRAYPDPRSFVALGEKQQWAPP